MFFLYNNRNRKYSVIKIDYEKNKPIQKVSEIRHEHTCVQRKENRHFFV